MGYLYEIATTAPAFLKPAHYDAHPPKRTVEPATVAFGPDRQQHLVFWEPDEVLHDMPVLYFHGGGYVFGEAESMEDAANVYNAQGYRFCSIGFREAPFHKFPAMVRDAFQGAKAALDWMEERGIPSATAPSPGQPYGWPGADPSRRRCCATRHGCRRPSDSLPSALPPASASRASPMRRICW